MSGIQEISPEVKEYFTGDIGVAAFLDHWIGGVEVRKIEGMDRCNFYLRGNDEKMHHVAKLVDNYNNYLDATPARSYREAYKGLAILLGRLQGPRNGN